MTVVMKREKDSDGEALDDHTDEDGKNSDGENRGKEMIVTTKRSSSNSRRGRT